MSVSPYFPTGFLEGVFMAYCTCLLIFFLQDFWRRLIIMMMVIKMLMMMFTRIIEAETRGSVRINY